MGKSCPTCGLTKAAERFSNRRKAKDGLNWQCRECSKARMAKQRDRYRSRAKVHRSEFVLRRCSLCSVEKPTTQFNLNAIQPHGMSYYCKGCDSRVMTERSKGYAAYHEKNPILYMDNDTKRCSYCKIDLPVSSFYRDKGRRDGLYQHCKACRKIERCLKRSDYAPAAVMTISNDAIKTKYTDQEFVELMKFGDLYRKLSRL